jgi:hypothetical protein
MIVFYFVIFILTCIGFFKGNPRAFKLRKKKQKKTKKQKKQKKQQKNNLFNTNIPPGKRLTHSNQIQTKPFLLGLVNKVSRKP